jgi:hypothetical protein
MNLKKSLKRLHKSAKAVSPILAVLFMIVVSVAAGLVTYAWVMGYLDFTTSKAGKAVQIQSIAYDSDTEILYVYVQNVGDGAIEFIASECYYVNGFLQIGATVDPIVLMEEETATATTTYPMVVGQDVLVRVTTVDGTFNEAGFTYEGEGDGGVVTPPPTVTQELTTDTGGGGFSGVTAGDLLVVMPNTRFGSWTGDALTCTAAGYTTLEVAAYRDDDGDRRAVAILIKTATGSETGTVSCTWGSSATTYATIYQIYRGATTWTYNGESGEASNGGGSFSTSIPNISGLSPSTTANVLSIGALVVRDSPGTVTITNLGSQDSSVSSNCYTFTEFSYGDAVTTTDMTWTTPRLATGLLLQIECS